MIGLNSICYCHTLKMTAVKDYGLSPLPLLHSFKRGLNSKYFFSLQMVITIHDNCKMGHIHSSANVLCIFSLHVKHILLLPISSK